MKYKIHIKLVHMVHVSNKIELSANPPKHLLSWGS